jgi:hypothetical protein
VIQPGPVIVTLRARQFAVVPVAGSFIAAAKGDAIYRVLSATGTAFTATGRFRHRLPRLDSIRYRVGPPG